VQPRGDSRQRSRRFPPRLAAGHRCSRLPPLAHSTGRSRWLPSHPTFRRSARPRLFAPPRRVRAHSFSSSQPPPHQGFPSSPARMPRWPRMPTPRGVAVANEHRRSGHVVHCEGALSLSLLRTPRGLKPLSDVTSLTGRVGRRAAPSSQFSRVVLWIVFASFAPHVAPVVSRPSSVVLVRAGHMRGGAYPCGGAATASNPLSSPHPHVAVDTRRSRSSQPAPCRLRAGLQRWVRGCWSHPHTVIPPSHDSYHRAEAPAVTWPPTDPHARSAGSGWGRVGLDPVTPNPPSSSALVVRLCRVDPATRQG
jgi:hypothetical protein